MSPLYQPSNLNTDVRGGRDTFHRHVIRPQLRDSASDTEAVVAAEPMDGGPAVRRLRQGRREAAGMLGLQVGDGDRGGRPRGRHAGDAGLGAELVGADLLDDADLGLPDGVAEAVQRRVAGRGLRAGAGGLAARDAAVVPQVHVAVPVGGRAEEPDAAVGPDLLRVRGGSLPRRHAVPVHGGEAGRATRLAYGHAVGVVGVQLGRGGVEEEES